MMNEEIRQEANRLLTIVESLIGYKIKFGVRNGENVVVIRKVFDNQHSKWVDTDSADWWKS